jgi:hypothetical protein
MVFRVVWKNPLSCEKFLFASNMACEMFDADAVILCLSPVACHFLFFLNIGENMDPIG